MKTKVVVIQRVCTHYRVPLFERLAKLDGINLTIYFGRLPARAHAWKLQNDPQIRRLKHKELRSVWFRLRFGNRMFLGVLSPGLLLQLMKDRPDIIICEGESNIINNVGVIIYATLRHIPYIWWGLGRIRNTRPSCFRGVLRPIISSMLRNSTSILAYSTFAKEFYASYAGVDAEKIAVVHNSIDTDKVLRDIKEYAPHVAEAKSQLKVSGKKIILFVGAFEKAKRIDVLIEAYRKLRDTYDDIALVLVGDGEERARLEALTEQMSINDVVFTGQKLEDVSVYFLMADVFVLPGLGGLAINQAMVHGKPIVTCSADGTELDMVEEGENGVIVPEGDAEAFRKAIERLLNDASLRERMSERSRCLALGKFNMSHQIQIIGEAIRSSTGERI